MKKLILVQKTIPLLMLLLLAGATGLAQSASKDQAHAALLIRFARSIQWPSTQTQGDFVIGVMGNPSLSANLRVITAARKIGNQNVVIRDVDVIADAYLCHVLFVANTASATIATLKKGLINSPTLLVTEKSGTARNGGCISFVADAQGKLQFEINETAIRRRGLKVPFALGKFGIPMNDV